jgi:hypothetical protein
VCVAARVDAGMREGLTTEEPEEIRQFRREVFELRRANSILKEASLFAKELDPDRRCRIISSRAPRAMARHWSREYANLTTLLEELYHRFH